MSNNLKQDILNAARNGYEPINDPSTKIIDWSKASTPIKVNKDDVVLTFREYNDMLTKIYYLESKNRWLENVNRHLGEEIESLQKQSLNRKLHKVRCICRLKCAQRMCSYDNKRYN